MVGTGAWVGWLRVEGGGGGVSVNLGWVGAQNLHIHNNLLGPRVPILDGHHVCAAGGGWAGGVGKGGGLGRGRGRVRKG